MRVLLALVGIAVFAEFLSDLVMGFSAVQRVADDVAQFEWEAGDFSVADTAGFGIAQGRLWRGGCSGGLRFGRLCLVVHI